MQIIENFITKNKYFSLSPSQLGRPVDHEQSANSSSPTFFILHFFTVIRVHVLYYYCQTMASGTVLKASVS